MKINEIYGRVDEAFAPYQALKGLAQGGLSGAVQGFKSAGAANKQQQVVKNVASRAASDWAKQEQLLKTAGQPATPADVVAWFTKFTGGKAPADKQGPTSTSPAIVNQWLQKEVANYIVQKNTGISGTSQPEKTPPEPTPPAGQEPAPAGSEVDTPAQGKVTKREDGKWYNEQGQQIVDPTDIAKLEKNTKQPVAPAAGAETITIGGQKLNPKNPKDAELIKKLQGQLAAKEPQAPEAPAASQDLPDISALSPEDRAELRKQLVASIQQSAS